MFRISGFVFLAVALILALSAVQAQGVQHLVASEPFAYPAGNLGTLNGGVGWAYAWWAGPNGDSVRVRNGGWDGLGGRVRTVGKTSPGAFRQLDLASWPLHTDGGMLGLDNTTVWVNFYIRKVPSSQDTWAGLSLWNSTLGESLFLGRPFNQTSWGFESYGSLPHLATIPVGNVNALTYFTVRVDFLPGNERLRLWLNDAAMAPNCEPDMDTYISDLRFDFIRIQSGGGTTKGGYFFDGLKVRLEDPQLVGAPLNLAASTGGVHTLNMNVGSTYAGFAYQILGSLGGTCPGVTHGNQHIALNPDDYFLYTLLNPNSGALSGGAGMLDAQGRASAVLTLPPFVMTAVPQISADHVAVVLDPVTQDVVHTTYPATLFITP